MSKRNKYSHYGVDNSTFARIFWSHVKEIPRSEGFTLNRVIYSLRYSIRLWSDKPHTMISKKVAEHFIANYPNEDPFQVRWTTRKRYGMDEKKRSLLVLEHTTPVGIFSSQMVACRSPKDIEDLMESYSGVCLVTREEDDLLIKRGYIKSRPNGWQAAYQDCGIEVLDSESYLNLL